jgi:glycerol-3-phosphate acyltransferase PlsY
MSAAIALVLALAATTGLRAPVFALGVAVAVFVFWSHRANIGRLRRGEEHSFRRRREGAAASGESAP